VTTADSCRLISGIHPRLARVLVVVDDPRVARSLGELLADEFVVQTTTRPEDALASLLRGVWYDVILSDVMMPGMTGIDLYERLREVHPTRAARMVFMTGGVDDDRVRAVLDGLPNLVLDKPVDVADLRELVRRRTFVEPRHRHSA
jgi:CheY-like chemotaxis protein